MTERRRDIGEILERQAEAQRRAARASRGLRTPAEIAEAYCSTMDALGWYGENLPDDYETTPEAGLRGHSRRWD